MRNDWPLCWAASPGRPSRGSDSRSVGSTVSSAGGLSGMPVALAMLELAVGVGC